MRAESVYVIPCICGQTVESNSPTARRYCEDLTVIDNLCPGPAVIVTL